MRLNKHLSEAGFCSRREADRLIGEGRVTVNGVRARVGAEVGEGDKVAVDGQTVAARAAGAPNKRKHVYIAYHKPVGVTCTTEAEVPGNIIEAIGHEQRIFPIGRLDKDSEGLILLTSNGDIVNEILRAENSKDKEYRVGVNKDVTPEFLRGMARGGIPMHGQTTLPCKVSKIGPVGFRIVLTQGLNRQIRLMCQHFGYRVKRLYRSRIVNIDIGRLKPGQWRNLTDPELRGLLPQRTSW